jgi:hypothetical protein
VKKIPRLVRLLLALCWLATCSPVSLSAQKTVHVKPYTKKDGTHVSGYDRRPPSNRTSSATPPAPAASTPPTSTSTPTLPPARMTGEATQPASTTADTASALAAAGPTSAPASVVTESSTAVLLGKSATAIRSMLGDPSTAANDAWAYDTANGTLHLVFEYSIVKEARPPNFDLSVLPAPRAASPPRPLPPPKRPSGAVAKCADGLYVFTSTGNKTCSKNQGVAEWYDQD